MYILSPSKMSKYLNLKPLISSIIIIKHIIYSLVVVYNIIIIKYKLGIRLFKITIFYDTNLTKHKN